MPGTVVTFYVHFAGDNTEARGGEGTCPDAELEVLEPWLEGTQHRAALGAQPLEELTIEGFLFFGIEFILI